MIMADVIAMLWADVIALFIGLLEIFGRCYDQIWQWTVIDLFWWLILLPLVADGMPLVCDVADVITTLFLLADVICHWWLME